MISLDFDISALDEINALFENGKLPHFSVSGSISVEHNDEKCNFKLHAEYPKLPPEKENKGGALSMEEAYKRLNFEQGRMCCLHSKITKLVVVQTYASTQHLDSLPWHDELKQLPLDRLKKVTIGCFIGSPLRRSGVFSKENSRLYFNPMTTYNCIIEGDSLADAKFLYDHFAAGALKPDHRPASLDREKLTSFKKACDILALTQTFATMPSALRGMQA